MPVFVNSKEITDEEVFDEMQYHPASSRNEATELAAKALVIRELLVQEAIRNGFINNEENTTKNSIDPNDGRIEKLLLQEVKIPQTDMESCQRFYENNKKRFTAKNGEIAKFDEVKEIIAEYLRDCSWQIAVRQYIKILASKAKIIGIDFEISDSPLMQ